MNPRMLIVGGGIAGLTLTTALHRRGIPAELIERDADWRPVGGGIAVQPNAMRVLNGLGVGPAILEAGTVICRWLFRDQRGDPLCEIDLTALWGDVGPFVGIERRPLHQALLAGGPQQVYHLATSIGDLHQTDDAVEVTFSDGREDRYDLVVGADGILSRVRQIAFGESPPAYGTQMVWRSLAPVALPDRDAVQFWLGEGCFFGLCPVGGDCTYGFANVTQPRTHDPVQGRLQRLRARFAGFDAPVQDYLNALTEDAQVHCGPIDWLETEQWRAGRVVLIGDAAHASSPMMGQGGCMAMEDAEVLAETLSAESDLDAALATFVARRSTRVDWVRRQSLGVSHMLNLPPADRNAALRQHGRKAFHDRFQPLTAAP